MSAAAKKDPKKRVAELKAILEREAPSRKRLAQKCADLEVQNATTIAMLQQRVAMRFEDIELPGGGRVAIRTSLSETETRLLAALREEFIAMRTLTPKEAAREDALRAELITLVMKTPESIRRSREIVKELEELYEFTEAEKARVHEIDYEIIAIITADEELTVEWFKAHPSAFSHNDLVWIINGFRAQQIRQAREREERIAMARSFRLIPDGT